MMTHKYSVTGMTCASCRDKVTDTLSQIAGITKVSVSLENKEAEVQMEYHVPTETLNKALAEKGNYHLEEQKGGHHSAAPSPTHSTETDEPITLKSYWPLILVFLYIIGGVAIGQVMNGFNWMSAMNIFMGLFFITFSFFKLLDLQGFAMSYLSYDIVAQRWIGYGYLYPFIELALGIAYLTHFDPIITNSVTLVVMSVSTIGVLRSVLRKSKFKCACLGTVFNLPMSTVTLVEDGLMVAMAATMLITLL